MCRAIVGHTVGSGHFLEAWRWRVSEECQSVITEAVRHVSAAGGSWSDDGLRAGD